MPVTFTLSGNATVYGRKERPRHIAVAGASVLLHKGEPPHPHPKTKTLEPGDTVWVEEAVTLSSFHNAQVTVSEKDEVPKPKKKGKK